MARARTPSVGSLPDGATRGSFSSRDGPPTFSREALAARRTATVESSTVAWERQIESFHIGSGDHEGASEAPSLAASQRASEHASLSRAGSGLAPADETEKPEDPEDAMGSFTRGLSGLSMELDTSAAGRAATPLSIDIADSSLAPPAAPAAPHRIKDPLHDDEAGL